MPFSHIITLLYCSFIAVLIDIINTLHSCFGLGIDIGALLCPLHKETQLEKLNNMFKFAKSMHSIM